MMRAGHGHRGLAHDFRETSMMNIVLGLCALISSVAADLIVVDDTGGVPGSFTTIQAAVDAATGGDTVLVVGSGIETFQESVVVDGKGITLVSDTGVTARMRTLRVSNVPAFERVLVRGVSVGLPGDSGQADIALRVVACLGAVRLEDSVFQGDGGFAGFVIPFEDGYDGARGASITNCGNVAAARCRFAGGGGADLWDEDFDAFATNGGDGAVVTSSTAHFSDCEFVGGSGGSVFDTTIDSGGAGRDGLVVTDSEVSLAGCTASGGHGGSGDCELFGCGSGGSGGDGVAQFGPTSVTRVRGVVASPGTGGFSGDGFPSADGQPFHITAGAQVVYPALHREFSLTSPVRAGVDDVVLSFDGLGGDVAFIWPALDTAQAFLPKYQGPLLLNWTIGTGPILIGPLPPFSGELDVTLPVPVIPGFDALDVTIQAIFDDGSDVLLGPAETLTLLGA